MKCQFLSWIITQLSSYHVSSCWNGPIFYSFIFPVFSLIHIHPEVLSFTISHNKIVFLLPLLLSLNDTRSTNTGQCATCVSQPPFVADVGYNRNTQSGTTIKYASARPPSHDLGNEQRLVYCANKLRSKLLNGDFSSLMLSIIFNR